MGLFDNAVEVVINNKIVQSIKTPRGGTLYEKGNGTVLTIDVPLNIVYSDAFNISGTLKDSNQTGLSGETVKLKVGNTVVDSTTTTTGGAYSFTQTPVATGNHSFQVIYEGSLSYNASQSTVVNRVVNKETTVLSVTSPTDNYMTYDSSITFTGTLTDDDGTVLADKTINIKEGANIVTMTTTDSNGAFSTELYSLSAGTHYFSIVYEGDANYTNSSVNRSVIIREHNYAISISADNPILSYEDGESCTVTAVLTDNSVLVSGETLSYTVKHGSTTLDSGSATTDANGSISFSYTATGVGDVDIEVSFGILLQETFVVEDCLRYDDASTDKTSDYSYSSTVTSFTHSVDHYEAVKSVTVQSGANYYSPVYIDETLPTNFEISVDLNISGISNYIQTGLCVSDAHITTYQGVNECSVLKNTAECGLFYRVSGSLTKYAENTNLARDTWYKYLLKVEGTSVTAKIIRISDNTVMYNQTKTLSNIQSWKKWNLLMGYDKQTLSFKNLKIKAL